MLLLVLRITDASPRVRSASPQLVTEGRLKAGVRTDPGARRLWGCPSKEGRGGGRCEEGGALGGWHAGMRGMREGRRMLMTAGELNSIKQHEVQSRSSRQVARAQRDRRWRRLCAAVAPSWLQDFVWSNLPKGISKGCQKCLAGKIDARTLAGATAQQCHAQERARCIAGICSAAMSSSASYMSKSFRRGQRGLWRCYSGERRALWSDLKQLCSL